MSFISTTSACITQAHALKELASIFVPTLVTLFFTPLTLKTIPIRPLDHDMGANSSEREGIESDGIKERRIQGMELVISFVQDEAMAFHVGGVHEVFVLVTFGTTL
jgi:hypothetical protein